MAKNYSGYQMNPYGFMYQQPSYGTAQGQTPVYPTTQLPVQTGTMYPIMSQPQTQQIAANIPGMLPIEQSYIENILRLNKGKLATVYAIFDTALGDDEGTSLVFTGVIEAAGRDHLILSDPQTGKRVLLPMVYFGYATFDEPLEYEYPFSSMTQQGVSSYSPR